MTTYKLKRNLTPTVQAERIFDSGTITIKDIDISNGYEVPYTTYLIYNIGDYIVTLKDGNKFPMKKEIFEFLYEEVVK